MEKVESLVELNTELRQKKDAIVLLTQNDCAKCEIIKNVLPIYESQGEVTKPVFALNLDDEGVDRDQVIKYFDIMSTPVLIGYKDGELVEKVEGSPSPMHLAKLEAL